MISRAIWLCADDYGMAPGVNAAIRDLVTHGRLNATSVMTLAPSFNEDAAGALLQHNKADARVAIGLHVTLTAPFRPLTRGFRPLADGLFLPVNALLVQAMMRRLDTAAVEAEVTAQLAAFIKHFGRPPDFVDGHQHVQLFPQIRDGLLRAVKDAAPNAWVRQCGRIVPWSRRLGDRKALLLDTLSAEFRRRTAAFGLRTNPAFAGTYDFHPASDFSAVFPRFLKSLPADGLIMCHPGFVDDELTRLDPLTTLREREHAFFRSDAFPALLASRGYLLASQ